MSATFGADTGPVSLGSVRNHKHVASQVTGSLKQSQLPDLAATQFENVADKNLAVANVPASIGSKFTTGTLTESQMFDASTRTIPSGKLENSGNISWAQLEGTMTASHGLPAHLNHVGDGVGFVNLGGYMFASIRAYHTNWHGTYPGSQLVPTAYYRTGETRLFSHRAGIESAKTWGTMPGTWRIFADHGNYWHGGDSNPTWLGVLAVRVT